MDVAGVIAEYEEVAAAWIFGSVARGEARADSDLDVAVLLRDPARTALDASRRMRDLAARIEQIVARPVDLVVLGLGDPILAHAVLAEGQLVLDRHRDRRIAFQADTYSRYFDWAPIYERTARASLAANAAWARR